MQKISEKIKSVDGYKRYLLSFFLGMLVTLALPPVFFIPAAIAGFTGHIWQLESCPNRKTSLWLGWWFGWGHFTSGLYWISLALLADAENFAWMIPFAVFGIPAVLAFYTAIISLLTFSVPKRGYQRVILFATFWTIIEVLRGILFTGFPWNLTGYIWTFSDNMLQLASVTGIWGLSFFTVLAFAMPSCAKKSSLKPTIISFLLLAIIWAGGYYRLQNAEKGHTNVMVRVVQANISQHQKWDESLRNHILQKYIDMTHSDGFKNISHVVWPESAIPFLISEDSGIIPILKNAIPKNGTLITGSMHADISEYGFVNEMWNSMHIINSDGQIVGIYNKHHLVPFGEYVPFRSILPIEKITAGYGDFSRGTGPRTISINNLPDFSPLICYEAIFPEGVADKQNRPELMINVTNDAWYGKSSGPYQHFNMVRVRSVEQGAPLIRSANTGISAIIDAYGRVVKKTHLGKTEIIDEYIPNSIKEDTIYEKHGYYAILLIIVIFSGFTYIKRY